ncbi:MAG: hypothetical protein SOX43_03960 [Pelistega sp.]|nr:hypothetical protein [Pelistega sp.]
MLLKKAFLSLLGFIVLLSTFLLYLKPEMIIQAADLVWGCFY